MAHLCEILFLKILTNEAAPLGAIFDEWRMA